MTVLYLTICVTNFFLLDRQISFKAPTSVSKVSEILFSEDEPSKIKKLHRCVLDERRKLVPDDVVLALGLFMELSFHPENTKSVFRTIDLSLRARPASAIFLVLKVFRI